MEIGIEIPEKERNLKEIYSNFIFMRNEMLHGNGCEL